MHGVVQFILLFGCIGALPGSDVSKWEIRSEQARAKRNQCFRSSAVVPAARKSISLSQAGCAALISFPSLPYRATAAVVGWDVRRRTGRLRWPVWFMMARSEAPPAAAAVAKPRGGCARRTRRGEDGLLQRSLHDSPHRLSATALSDNG